MLHVNAEGSEVLAAEKHEWRACVGHGVCMLCSPLAQESQLLAVQLLKCYLGEK